MKNSKILKAIFCSSFLIFSFLTGCAQEGAKDAQAHYERGLAYYKNKEFKKAQDSLREALQLNGRDAKFHNLLGLALQGDGLFEDARRSYREALRLNKRFEEARINLLNIDKAKGDYALHKFASDFIYNLSVEYSNGNNAFSRGVNESRAVKNQSGNVMGYDVSSDVYLAKEYFEKCSRALGKTIEAVSVKSFLDIAERFSEAIQLRRESIDLQVEGYTMAANYAGEFERAAAKVKIADTYYVDSARKLEALMQDRPTLFGSRDFSNLKRLIDYYSGEKRGEIGPVNLA